MDREPDTSPRSANWGALPRLLLLAAILLSMVPPAPKAEAAARVQPTLLQLAAEHPDARIASIRAAGEQRVPFTSGLLIGIGETRQERIDALKKL